MYITKCSNKNEHDFFLDFLDVFNIFLMILWPGKSGREKNIYFLLAIIHFILLKKEFGLIMFIRPEKSTEVYSEPFQTSKMELSGATINESKPLTIFPKKLNFRFLIGF